MKIIYSILMLQFAFLSVICAQTPEIRFEYSIVGFINADVETVADRLFINVINQSGVEQQVYILASLRGRSGEAAALSANNLLSDPVRIIVPTEGLQMSLRQLIEQYQESSLEEYAITTPAIRDLIINERKLPQGEYQFCLEARDFLTQELRSLPAAFDLSTCHIFEIEYLRPPEIQSPTSGAWIPENDLEELQFFWSMSDFRPSTRFKLEMIEFPSFELAQLFDNQGRPDDIFEAYDPILEEENLIGFNYSTFQADTPIDIDPQDWFAIRVTASDDTYDILNQGRSRIVIFAYGVPMGSECTNPALTPTLVFPSPQDTLPFTLPFILVQIDPDCDNILEINSTFAASARKNGVVNYNNNPIQLNENFRAAGGRRNHLTQYLTEHQPSRISTYFPAGSDRHLHTLLSLGNVESATQIERGSNFAISGLSNVTVLNTASGIESDRTLNFNDMIGNPLTIGMPKPRLMLPSPGDTLAPGEVVFSYSTGNPPTNLLPPYKAYQRLPGFQPSVLGLRTYEKCVIQISKDSLFTSDSIVASRTKKIQANAVNRNDNFSVDNPAFEAFSPSFDTDAELGVDISGFSAKVYKDLSAQFNLPTNGKYFWRVVWLVNPDDVNVSDPHSAGIDITESMVYHVSEYRRLIIDPSGDSGGPRTIAADDPDSESGCSSPCTFPAITDTEAVRGPRTSETFRAAGFTFTVTESNGNVNSLTGEGYVRIPWLNNVKLECSFSGIGVNNSGQMVSGDITLKKDSGLPEVSTRIHEVGQLLDIGDHQARAIEGIIVAGSKLVRILANDQTTTLPIGIDRVIDGRTIIVGISEMVFRKDTAFMHLVVNLEIPEIEVAGGGAISLGSKVCITNGGLGNDVRLYLPRDVIFPLGNGHEFRINGAGERTADTYITSVEFDCNGFRSLNLAGSVLFDRSVLLPEKADGTIDTTSTAKVRGQFSVRLDQGINALIQLEIDRFQAVDLPNWSFHATGVSFDLSDRSNPEGLRSNLPAGYNHAAFNTGGMENTWKGFYMRNLQIRTPHALKADGGDRLTFTVEGLIIDPDISFNIYATNIARWTETDDASTFNGWSASLDTVQFVMVQNNPRKIGFAGKVGLPIAARTQYVKYSANLLLTSVGNNLVIQARPDGNLTIPIAMAQAVITDNTYLRASIGDSNYIEVNLCATFGFSNTHAPNSASGESQMNQSFNLPSIAIQNLRVNTIEGMVDSVFAFSLDGGRTWRGEGEGVAGGDDDDDDDDDGPRSGESSTESDLGGFPIGLRQLGFANNKVNIEPYITLGSGDGGFSASALIDIGLTFGDNFDRFDVTGIDLRKICLNVMASDVKIAGCVEFYKDANQVIGGITGRSEGVRGGITMEFNMGTKIGLDINANFGTFKSTTGGYTHGSAGWFDYFYVDGMAYISSGITIMSGVSLFGVGGGFWHRMSQDSLLLPNTVSISEFDGSQPRNSEEGDGEGDETPPDETTFRTYTPDASVHARYRPNHDVALGLRFTVILGSNDMGKAYNIDASLTAIISSTAGLTYIGITGNFRVMSDGISLDALNGRSQDPLSGSFGVELNMPGDGSFTFSGYFRLKVKVPYTSPILSGGGEGGLAVSAEFYVNNTGYWYFYMGKPEPGKYCSLKLEIGGQIIAELKSYIMIGNGIPLTMPAPDERFMAIFNEAAGMREPIRSADGDPASFLSGAPRDDTAASGDGFALGMSLALNIPPVPLPPFYFDLQFVLGFDINVTQDNSGTRRCSGSDIRPGANNNYWYATGQMYAGIRGSFGLGIPYFIPDLKIEIFRGAAAILMQGGLLGPDWFSARGHFSYNVMGHSGSCSFRAEMGEVCLPTLGNPFAGIDLIEDVSPGSGARDVSVYTDITGAFSVSMDRDYEFPEMALQGDPPIIRTFKPYVAKMELRELSSTGPIVPVSSQIWSDNQKVLKKTFERPLASERLHFIAIECRIGEKKFGRYTDVPATPGSRIPFKNDTLLSFTSGLEPDILTNEVIDFTYPYLNQRNFLKGETDSNKGIIRATYANNRALTPLTRGGSNPASVSYSAPVEDRFYIRFTSNTDTINAPAELFDRNRGVTFDVSRLEPSTIYCAQLIRYNPAVSNRQQILMGGDDRLKNVTLANYGNLSAGDAGTVNIDGIVSRVRLPQGVVNRGEKEIYAFYFKTSRYLTLGEKMAAERSDWSVETVTGWGIESKHLSSPMTEDFEWLDNEAFVSPATRGTVTARSEGNIELGFSGRPSRMGDLFDPDLVQNLYLTLQYERDIYQRHDRAYRIRNEIASRPYTGVDISTLIPQIYANIWEDRFYGSMVRFANVGNNVHFAQGPLTQAELSSNFRDALILPTGLLTFTGMIPIVNIPTAMMPPGVGSSVRANNALIWYTPHVEGIASLMELQRGMRRFQMTIPLRMGPFSSPAIRDLMTASERTIFDRTCLLTLPQIIDVMRPVPGFNHQFTMRYRYPNANGGTQKGSRFNFTFTY